MKITEYLKEIQKTYADGGTKEHSFRSPLETYLKAFLSETISVIQEPEKDGSESPDFDISKSQISIGKIETKKLDADLKKLENTNQLVRYKGKFENLIFTNYLEFIHYKKGKKRDFVKIAEFKNDKIIPLQKNFDKFTELLEDFCGYEGKSIGTPKKLAKIMAKKTKFMATAFQTVLKRELAHKEPGSTKTHFNFFKSNLIYDITVERFASVYAETITYGLFVARIYYNKFNSSKREKFSRNQAYEYIPENFPFLKELFTNIIPKLKNEEIREEVEELCEFFGETDIEKILEGMKRLRKQDQRNEDPAIYFYEDFLKEYNPAERKERGVYYTPAPVVNFIVRAMDSVLKNHFSLPEGIADKSKITISVKEGKREKKRELHKVQLLDVATGTGSFLAEVIKQIYKTFQGQAGLWSGYVEEHLLPRLHGFEILMSAYAMCHLKINLLLKETGYTQLNSQQRLGVYLTNALEQPKENQDRLPPKDLLEKESKEADQIKRETSVMVAFGNPPYLRRSKNKGEWILKKIKEYKENLNEKNIQPLSNDYIKFIRMAEYYIQKTGDGIVAMITSNSFLYGPTYRQMRKHLLETFDCIYIYNLHGDINRDGRDDKNVFNIKEGVVISIFIKNNKKQGKLADVFYLDSYGKREDKYQRLWEGDLEKMPFKKLNYKESSCFFVPKDFSAQEEYDKMVSLKKIFSLSNVGTATGKDKIFVANNKEDLMKNLQSNSLDFITNDIIKYNYRIFDNHYFLYNNKHIQRLRQSLMKHFKKDNFSLVTTKILSSKSYNHSFISTRVSDRCYISNKGQEANYFFPLYLYNDHNSIDTEERTANLNQEIVAEIEQKLGLKFIADHELPEAKNTGNFSPLDLLDYIYAVLHSPNYREKYKEFLKIDFPRVPYPEDKEKFKKLVKLGSQLRQTHLLQGEKFASIQNLITNYDIQGNNLVEKIYFDADDDSKLGKVYINKTQYFGKVPKVAWDFFIGCYQPAQKWLRDRKDRILNNEDIEHYQKIILALKTTAVVIQKIDSNLN